MGSAWLSLALFLFAVAFCTAWRMANGHQTKHQLCCNFVHFVHFTPLVDVIQSKSSSPAIQWDRHWPCFSRWTATHSMWKWTVCSKFDCVRHVFYVQRCVIWCLTLVLIWHYVQRCVPASWGLHGIRASRGLQDKCALVTNDGVNIHLGLLIHNTYWQVISLDTTYWQVHIYCFTHR